MARINQKSVDDDFVMTMSDDDSDILELEEEELEEVVVKPEQEKNKKRKRDAGKDEPSPKGKAKRSKNPKLSAKEISDEEDIEEENNWAAGGENDGAMDSDFEFTTADGGAGELTEYEGWGFEGAAGRSTNKGVDIDEIIARRRAETNGDLQEADDHDIDVESEEGKALDEEVFGGFEEEEEDDSLSEDGFGMAATLEKEEDAEEEDSSSEIDGEDNEDAAASDDESVATPEGGVEDDMPDISDSEDEKEDEEEAAKRKAFFAPEDDEKVVSKTSKDVTNSFQSMNISRPILRGLATVGFSQPTPIQAKAIPVALLGKDIVGGAVTGSGKTAAFIVPILERLLYRPKKVPTSRVAILTPTRELAIQCHAVATKLASFTDIKFCLAVGGLSLKAQEAELRLRPDVIIATPGRFIDHMRNSPSFTIDTLEILVLDEADRMLEDGFADELNEVLTTIPKSRQSMLFSATMTESVDKLIRIGMNRPVRLMVDNNKRTVGTLSQEFLRIRPGKEDKRLAYLMLLCDTVYKDEVIIFFRKKHDAHRAKIIFGLCGKTAAELHGSLSQEQVRQQLTCSLNPY
jgi:ATP-dependent RNA helicase DDX27